MFEYRTFITVKEIGEVLGVSESKYYGVVCYLNKELAEKGYMVISVRVSRKYFEKRFYGINVKMVAVLKVIVIPALFARIVVCGLYLSMQNKLEVERM